MKEEVSTPNPERPSTGKRWSRDTVSGLALIALSVWLWAYTASFPRLDDGYPGPSLFPRLVALGLGFAGCVLLFQSWLNRSDLSKRKRKIHRIGIARFAAGMGMVIAYAFIIEQVHFIVVMSLLIFVFGLLLSASRWQALIAAVLSAVSMYALFTQLLGVPL